MRRRIATIAVFAVAFALSALAQVKIDLNKKIYEPEADARQEIARAIQQAAAQHKRVLLVFGANWCPDCHVLDFRFHQEGIRPLVEKNFIVTHIDIGEKGPRNQDVAQQYEVPLERGVPAIAVLSERGALLYSQKNGEFEAARKLPPEAIVAFLKQWAPPGP